MSVFLASSQASFHSLVTNPVFDLHGQNVRVQPRGVENVRFGYPRFESLLFTFDMVLLASTYTGAVYESKVAGKRVSTSEAMVISWKTEAPLGLGWSFFPNLCHLSIFGCCL